VSGSLERFLIERGERVLRIPTHLTAAPTAGRVGAPASNNPRAMTAP
jgi:hypothetical protein